VEEIGILTGLRIDRREVGAPGEFERLNLLGVRPEDGVAQILHLPQTRHCHHINNTTAFLYLARKNSVAAKRSRGKEKFCAVRENRTCNALKRYIACATQRVFRQKDLLGWGAGFVKQKAHDCDCR
jgi:hypothetical protein